MRQFSSGQAGSRASSTQGIVLLDVIEVAKLMTCSTRHVRRLTDRGAMPAPVRIGALVRWRRTDIEEWIADDCPNLSKRRAAK